MSKRKSTSREAPRRVPNVTREQAERQDRELGLTPERKADLRTLRQPGTYPNTEDSAALRLAEAIHYAESQDCAVD